MTNESNFKGTGTSWDAAYKILTQLIEDWDNYTDSGKQGHVEQAIEVLKVDVEDAGEEYSIHERIGDLFDERYNE